MKSGNYKKNKISFKRKVSFYYKRFALIFKLLLVLFVCLFLFTDLFKGVKVKFANHFYAITSDIGFVLDTVIIQGQQNAPVKDIIATVGIEKGDPIFSADIAKIKDRLEEHIWIKGAIIERRLPKTLHIAIVERSPVAIWQFNQKLYLVDSEGNRITHYDGRGFAELIQVVGPDANIYAHALLEDLNRYPDLAAKVKSAVRYGQRRWNLNLDEGISVKMPEDDFEKAYKYLNKLFVNKKLFGQNYKSLDFRDPNKYFLEKK